MHFSEFKFWNARHLGCDHLFHNAGCPLDSGFKSINSNGIVWGLKTHKMDSAPTFPEYFEVDKGAKSY